MPESIPPGWARILRRTRLRVNAAAWLSEFLPGMFLLLIAGAVVLIALRAARLPLAPFAPAIVLAAAALVVVSWRRARGAFWSDADARLRLESAQSLRSRLSAAAEGIAAWPQPPADAARRDDRFRWRLAPALVRPALGVLLLAAAALFPVRERETRPAPPTAQVPAWSEVEEWVETMAETGTPDPEALERFREELDELLARPPEERFSHASLEAADNLRDRVEQSIGAFAGQLANADRALSESLPNPAPPSPAALDAAAAALQEAVEGLRAGSLPLSGPLSERLAALANQGALRTIDPSQLSQLQSELRRGVQGAQACLSPLAGEGDGTSQQQPGPGQGGIQRGPGEAPLALGEAAPPLDSDMLAPLEPGKTDQAALGDTLRTETVAPEADPAGAAAGPAGGWAAGAQGGQAASSAAWLPDESLALQRFYQ